MTQRKKNPCESVLSASRLLYELMIFDGFIEVLIDIPKHE